MKRYIVKCLLLTALFFSASSCSEEFLEFVPEDQATVDFWYRNEGEIRQTTATLYGRVWWGVNDQFNWLAGDVLAGDLFHTWDAEGQFFLNSFNENNQYIAAGWQGFYDVISYANIIIDDMPVVASGYGVAEDVINKGLAEARFMRGYAYFMLVEYWGEAPIIERPGEKVRSGDLQLPKHTTASLYEFARRDLEFAAQHLPAEDVPGRVTSWAAKGMLAKLHVTLGQRSVGGGGIGSEEDFAIAASYAADVINNSGRQLYPNYENMFRIENEQNPEILFAPQLINSGWGFGSSRQARFARSTVLTGDNTGWGDGKGMAVHFVNTLLENAETSTDLRRKAIYMESGDVYPYLVKKSNGYTYKILPRDAKQNQTEGVSPVLNHLKKHIIGTTDDHGYAITNQDSPFDTYFLRLADVYLLYAEALLGDDASLSSGPGYDAYVAVRERAGLEAPADGDMTYEDLFNERRIELALEAQAWLDVKRRYYRNPAEALAYLNGQNRTSRYFRINSNDGLENDPAGYELVPAGGERTERAADGSVQRNTLPEVRFTSADMVLPIPGPEVITNPLLAEEPVEYIFE